MPCNDGGVPYPPTHEERLDARVPIPALCAILRTMGVKQYLQLLDTVNWQEAGITRDEFVEWWKLHQKRDRARQRREHRAEVERNRQRQALAKLNPDEVAALRRLGFDPK
jgi:hypothetical protein